MSLTEVQRTFWSIATREGGSASLRPDEIFVGTLALDARSRMEIYADMFVRRQIDALREDFPKLAALMDDDVFYDFGEDYVRAHPSVHHSLSKLGQHVATFLTKRPGSRSDLADMAALEWARAEVFEEAAVPTASPEILRSLAGDDFAGRCLAVVPALRLLRLEHNVLVPWRQIEEGRSPGDPRPGRRFAVVWRKGFDVFHVPVDPDEARALERAMAGEPLGEICQAFEDRPDAIEAAFRSVGSWFAEGWIAESSTEEGA